MISDIASVATAIGVFLALIQFWFSYKQSVTSFEDELAKEYRQLASTLPTKALLGEALSGEELLEHLDEFYHYFDLCNSQIFLRQKRRVSKDTWVFWVDGIKTNLNRPAFAAAWKDISSRANGDFSELRKLIAEGFSYDPKSW